MIFADDRIGAIELLPIILSHRSRPAAKSLRLTAGDFCFSGEGANGPCMIGIERKRLKDMLSSIRNGRLSGEQIPKLVEQYEYSYILLEGTFRTNWDTGYLEEPHGNREWKSVTIGAQPFLALELESYIDTISLKTPITVVYTRNERATADYLVGRERYYQKPWDKHHAHIALHIPSPATTLGKAGTVRRVAYVLQGLGWERSGTVSTRFKSVESMVAATPKDWEKLPGFGKILSLRVWKELHGEYDSGDGFE